VIGLRWGGSGCSFDRSIACCLVLSRLLLAEEVQEKEGR